jgi:GH15 family glucan-1,4-alpha-glucosidase
MQLTRGHVSDDRYAHWSDVAERIRQDIHAHGYNADLKTFTQAYGEDAVDAANFRLALVDYLPPTDERLRDTITTTGRILSDNESLIYRYRPAGDKSGDTHEDDATNDGLSGTEGAFLACAFWYVSNLALIGRVDEAHQRFDRLLHYASPLGLYSEEVEASTGALLGNYPQAYTHIGLINAAHNLHLAEERAQKASRQPPGDSGDSAS